MTISLRRRLPLLMSALIAVVLRHPVGGVSGRQAHAGGNGRRARERESRTRFGSMLVQSSQQKRTEMMRVASDDAVREYLRASRRFGGGPRPSCVAGHTTGVRRIELWTIQANVCCRWSSRRTRRPRCLPITSVAVDRRPLRVYGKAIFSETFVPVQGGTATPGCRPGHHGFLIIRRRLRPETPTSQTAAAAAR